MAGAQRPGQWEFVFAGVIYGIAFMRTRSIAAPLPFHVVGNLVHALLFAPLVVG